MNSSFVVRGSVISKPVVSLQDRTFVGSAENHNIAVGVLVGTDLAIFKLPADVLLHSERIVEVVIGPPDANDMSVIERFPPWHIEVASLSSSVDSRVCIVRLAHRSAYATPIAPLDREAFRSALTVAGDLVISMLFLGLDLPNFTDAQLLRAVDRMVQIEARQAKRVLTVMEGQEPGDILRCVTGPKCKPEPPQPGAARPRAWLTTG